MIAAKMDSKIRFSFLLLNALTMFSKAQELQRPDGVSKEMYCVGCEITLKELDLILRHKPTRGMGETVTRALDRVCDLSTFKKYDYNADTVLKVCRQIVEDEGLEAVLIGDYGRKHATGKDTSYLDISKKVCGTHLGACPTTVLIGDEEKGGSISYDPETEDFFIKDGHNVRKVNPVQEPNQTKEKPEDQPKEKSVDPPRIKDKESLNTDTDSLHQQEGHDEL